MTYIRKIAIAAVIAAATGIGLATQQAEAAFRWGNAIEKLQGVIPSSTFAAARWGNAKDFIRDIIPSSTMDARRRFGGG
jgi:hypothetical protein